MSAPESNVSANEALSSLMGAIIDSPEYARLVSAPRDWKAVQTAIDDYLEGYELRLDEGCHIPTDFERFLLVDAVAGLMHDDEFIDALYSAVTAARPSPAAGDARAMPELNADLIGILGRPNFACIHTAQLLRRSGVEIDKKAEAEQATVIHYLMGFYLKHGNQWVEKAGEDLERLRLAAIAAQQGSQGGK